MIFQLSSSRILQLRIVLLTMGFLITETFFSCEAFPFLPLEDSVKGHIPQVSYTLKPLKQLQHTSFKYKSGDDKDYTSFGFNYGCFVRAPSSSSSSRFSSCTILHAKKSSKSKDDDDSQGEEDEVKGGMEEMNQIKEKQQQSLTNNGSTEDDLGEVEKIDSAFERLRKEFQTKFGEEMNESSENQEIYGPMADTLPLAFLLEAGLLGRLGKDPTIKYFDNGNCVASFSIAVRHEYTPRERAVRGVKYGEEETDWYNVDVWGKSAEYMMRNAGKGSRVFVKGAIQEQQWVDKLGQDRKSYKIRANTIEVIDFKRKDDFGGGGGGYNNGYGGGGYNDGNSNNNYNKGTSGPSSSYKSSKYQKSGYNEDFNNNNNPDGDYDWSSTFMSADSGKDIGKSSAASSPMSTVDKSFQISSTFSNINKTPKSKTDSASTSSYIDFQGSGDEDFPF